MLLPNSPVISIVSDSLREADLAEGKLVGYARVSSTGQDLAVQLEKLVRAVVELDDIFKEKRTGTDRGRPQLQQCLAYVRRDDTLLVTKIDRLPRISKLQAKGVEFRVIDDPSIDTTSRTSKLVMGILALIAEFENDIRKERQLDGIAKAKERGVRFGVEPKLTVVMKERIKSLRHEGLTVPAIMKATELSKASVYRALAANAE
jgi:DNA invertase Pin-like site-specific DNA recombinase